jgi:hypothetical protein
VSKSEIGTAKVRPTADEIAWRDFWYAHVMTETGERGPAKKMSVQERGLTRRLHKPHRLKSAT